MKTLLMPQGSNEWLTARLGIPTASEMDSLVSPEGKVRTGAGPESFMYRKLAERLLGYAQQGGGSFATEQGHVIEQQAAPWYSWEYSVDIQRVGLCVSDDGRVAASPDALVGTEGGLEIKCFQPEHSLRVFIENQVPKEHVIQIQTALFVSRRGWWDFLSYSRVWPQLVIRVFPDTKIQTAIGEALDLFYSKFDPIFNKMKSIRDAENAEKTAAYLKAEGVA